MGPKHRTWEPAAANIRDPRLTTTRPAIKFRPIDSQEWNDGKTSTTIHASIRQPWPQSDTGLYDEQGARALARAYQNEERKIIRVRIRNGSNCCWSPWSCTDRQRSREKSKHLVRSCSR